MLVAPPHRPTLKEELARLPTRFRYAAIAVLALLAVAAIFLLAGGATAEDGTRVVVEEPIAFNLRYPDGMERVEDDALLHLQRPGKDEFTVEPLELPAYTGDVGGVLPVEASREVERLKERFPNLELVEEGKVRINRAAGYSLAINRGIYFRCPRAVRLSPSQPMVDNVNASRNQPNRSRRASHGSAGCGFPPSVNPDAAGLANQTSWAALRPCGSRNSLST